MVTRAIDVINQFGPDSGQPMFLYLAFQNVHWPLEAPQVRLQESAPTYATHV